MKSYCLLLFALFFCTILQAQNGEKQSVFDIFENDSLLEITLISDFHNLKKNKFKDDYQSATLVFKDKTDSLYNWKIEIKPRGKMRRKVCSMPPLKLRFPKADLKAQGLVKYRTLEMVEKCEKGKDYEQYVLREYVAYKLFNMLTDHSFRVQLVRINFENTGEGNILHDGFGFLIENNDGMAERLGGSIVEPESLGKKLPNTAEKELYAMFQFMIGNTDWYYTTAHNLDILLKSDSLTHIPIPYDFDYSGFVKTPYSMPNDRIPIKEVTGRFYMGPCRDEFETQQNIQLFLSKKDEMLSYCKAFPYFNKISRNYVVKYLKAFFDILESPNKLRHNMLNDCDFWDR